MSPQDRQALHYAICREDLLSFVRLCVGELLGGAAMEANWHLELVAAELQAAASGQPGATRRLIVNLPPRHLKSMIASVALSAWMLGRDPKAQILCVSYGQDLAATFGRQALQIMTSPWYATLFPKTKLRASNQSAADFATTDGGFRKATSVGGVLTGRGGNFIIIDDPLKAEDAYSESARNQLEEWFGRTLVSRLNNKQTGVIIVVMQRLHDDDLSGSLLRKGGWRHIRLPAIADEDEGFEITTGQKTRLVGRKRGQALHAAREPLEVLHELKQTQGESVFAAQYQQNPLPASGNMVKTRWLQYYTPGDGVPKFDQVFQSWDTASKPRDDCDYSVCTTWGASARRLYLLDVFRERLDFPDLCRAVVGLKERYGAATVLVEDKASGTQVLQELRSRSVFWVKGIEPHGDKITRMQGQTVLIENGGVLLPKDLPWVSEYVRELTAFPHGRHDDQVDSTSQAISWFNPRVPEPTIITYYREKLERRALERGELSQESSYLPGSITNRKPIASA